MYIEFGEGSVNSRPLVLAVILICQLETGGPGVIMQSPGAWPSKPSCAAGGTKHVTSVERMNVAATRTFSAPAVTEVNRHIRQGSTYGLLSKHGTSTKFSPLRLMTPPPDIVPIVGVTPVTFSELKINFTGFENSLASAFSDTCTSTIMIPVRITFGVGHRNCVQGLVGNPQTSSSFMTTMSWVVLFVVLPTVNLHVRPDTTWSHVSFKRRKGSTV